MKIFWITILAFYSSWLYGIAFIPTLFGYELCNFIEITISMIVVLFDVFNSFNLVWISGAIVYYGIYYFNTVIFVVSGATQPVCFVIWSWSLQELFDWILELIGWIAIFWVLNDLLYVLGFKKWYYSYVPYIPFIKKFYTTPLTKSPVDEWEVVKTRIYKRLVRLGHIDIARLPPYERSTVDVLGLGRNLTSHLHPNSQYFREDSLRELQNLVCSNFQELFDYCDKFYWSTDAYVHGCSSEMQQLLKKLEEIYMSPLMDLQTNVNKRKYFKARINGWLMREMFLILATPHQGVLLFQLIDELLWNKFSGGGPRIILPPQENKSNNQ